MARKRILTDIVERLEKCISKEICSNKGRGWNLLSEIDLSADKLAQKSVEIVNSCCNTKLYPPKVTKDDLTKEEFSISWRNKEKVKSPNALIGVTENNLETFIMLAQESSKNGKWINQVPVPNGHVDIYRNYNEQLYLYELKIWNNGKNTPVYSILEDIKNYKLLPVKENKTTLSKFDIDIDNFKTVNLVILAPIEYFARYSKKESVETFLKYIHSLEKELKTTYGKTFNILLQAIDFKESDYRKFCENLITEINKNKTNSIYKGMEELKGQKWSTYFHILPKVIRENLKCENWKTIATVSGWINLKK